MAKIVQFEEYLKNDGTYYAFLHGVGTTRSHTIRVNTGFNYALLCGLIIKSGSPVYEETTRYNLVKHSLCLTCDRLMEKVE